MSYTPSAAAVHTARMLYRNFILTEAPGGTYQLNMDTVVKLIDVFTHAFKVEKVLKALTTTVHWLSKEELANNLERFQDAVRAIEIVHKDIPQYTPGETYDVSAPAVAATKVLMRNFTFTRNMETGRVEPTERNIAITIDVCTKVYITSKAMDEALSLPWQDKYALQRALEQLRKTVRALEYAHNYLPNYGPQNPMLLHRGQQVSEPRITNKQAQIFRSAAPALARAKSPEEEQRILHGLQHELM